MDEPPGILYFILLGVLMILSGFFSGSETALMAVSKVKLYQLIKEGKKRAQSVQNIISKPDKLLGTILVGNNLVNIAASSVATAIAIEFFGKAGVGIATGAVTLAILIFGEITPKTLAAYASERFSMFVAKPISLLMTLLNPVVTVLNKITHIILLPFSNLKTNYTQKTFATEEEIKTMVDVSLQEGEIEPREKDMIEGIFEFDDTSVKSVMTPRVDIFAIPYDLSVDEAIKVAVSHPYSRIPVYKDTKDDIIGMIHIRELMEAAANKEKDLKEVTSQVHFVPGSIKASAAFARLRAEKTHMAIVIDEYGGVSGLLTLEDLIEEIVGNISDEYDPEESSVITVDEDILVVAGDMEIEDIAEELDINFPEEDIKTIAGFLFNLFGKVPNKGETVKYDGYAFTVDKMEGNRISRIKIVQVTEKENCETEITSEKITQ